MSVCARAVQRSAADRGRRCVDPEDMSAEGDGDGKKKGERQSGGGARRRERLKEGAGVNLRGTERGCMDKAVAGGVQRKNICCQNTFLWQLGDGAVSSENFSGSSKNRR